MKDKRFNNVQMLKDNRDRYQYNELTPEDMLEHLINTGLISMSSPNEDSRSQTQNSQWVN
jgi:hypothetical protein